MKLVFLSVGLAFSAAAMAQVPNTIVIGSAIGQANSVEVLHDFNMATGGFRGGGSFMPYASEYQGGVRVAVGDITGDGVADIVTGTSTGAGHVKVFDGNTGSEIRSFFAFEGFAGGITVAAGDVNGDGRADIITATGAGGGPHVKVFSGANNELIGSFFAYNPGFAGGVRVAAGDVTGDGRADIITGAGAGGGPHVKAFSGVNLGETHSFFAYDSGFQGGVNVAAGDVNGDGISDWVTGTGGASTAHVKVFSGGSGAELSSFFAFPPSFLGGVNVATGDLDGDGRSEVFASGETGLTGFAIFDGSGNQRSFLAARNGSYIAAYSASAVPEPATMAALAVGALALVRRRKRSA